MKNLVNFKVEVRTREYLVQAIFQMLFNNQDVEERSNFLNSTPDAIEEIVSGEKVINGIDTRPMQTAINLERLSGLYYHLFGECFDTINLTKKKFNLSKYNPKR